MAAAWDACSPLPDAGENDALDAFVASKNLDIPALARLGTRLHSATVLAFALPGGIKFRSLETGKRWNYLGSEFTELKIVRAGGKLSDTVLIAEGETDAARLTMLYDADVAVLPAGAKRFTASFAKQLEAYERVVIAIDNDEAGDDGSARIMSLIRHAVRLAPPTLKDWCELEGDPPPLPEVTRGDHIGTIDFLDLTAAFNGEIPDPEILVDDMVYEEGVHLISGHPGSGKSIMAKTWAVLAMAEGRHVVWLDYEMGLRATGSRLAACGATLEQLQELFHYAWTPKDAESHLIAVAQRWPGAFVVFDSMSKALKLAGLDENSPGEVTGFTLPLITAAKAHHLPMVLIDHVTKGSKDSRYSRGSGSKLADADVHWTVEKVDEFNRETIGTMNLKLQKDREGFLPFGLWFRVGDGAGGLPVVPIDGPPDKEGEAAI